MQSTRENRASVAVRTFKLMRHRAEAVRRSRRLFRSSVKGRGWVNGDGVVKRKGGFKGPKGGGNYCHFHGQSGGFWPPGPTGCVSGHNNLS